MARRNGGHQVIPAEAVVTTVDELLALPAGTILRQQSDGRAFEVHGYEDYDDDMEPIIAKTLRWAGTEMTVQLDDLHAVFLKDAITSLPAEVVYLPRATK